MKYALVIAIEIDSDEGRQPWLDFSCNAVNKKDMPAGLSILNTGSFLFDLKDGLKSFSDLVLAAEKLKVEIRVLMFDGEPSWIIS